jgi:hypothetical protein
MKIIAVERPGAGGRQNPPSDALLEAEARRLWELRGSDIVREAYFGADRREAVLVLELPTVADAFGVLESLPLVAAGFIDFDVMALRPYDGFARLFSTPTPGGNNRTP